MRSVRYPPGRSRSCSPTSRARRGSCGGGQALRRPARGPPTAAPGAFAACGGREVDTQGDSFFVAFPSADRPPSRPRCRRQRSCGPAVAGRDSAVLVRMGVHTGEATAAGGGYVGLAVHRAARIAAAGRRRPGAVSEATAALAGEDLPDGTSLCAPSASTGSRTSTAPAALYQLDVAGLPAGVPAAAHAAAPAPAADPARRTSSGREPTIAALAALLTEGRARLVTVIGPGGIGKTRLAVETARTVAEAFPGGVVVRAARRRRGARPRPRHGRRRAVGARREPGVDPLDVAAPGPRGRAARCSCWTTSSRSWRRARTSRHSWRRCRRPWCWRPAGRRCGCGPSGSTCSRRWPRRRRSDSSPSAPPRSPPASRWTTATPSIVAEICRRLDGLPLAIELAAPGSGCCPGGPARSPGRAARRARRRAGRPARTAADPARDDGLELRPARSARAGRLRPARGVLRRLDARRPRRPSAAAPASPTSSTRCPR